MSGYTFDLAGPADDSDLRHVLAETPTDGLLSVSFLREPSFFAAAAIDGRERQVIAAREAPSGHVVGIASRSWMDRYVNGTPRCIGYLSSLRFLPEHRRLGLLARGYAFVRRLHEDGRTPLYLTTIAEGNAVALGVLTSGRVGLPRYHFAGRYFTAALPLFRCREVASLGIEVRAATEADRAAMVDFLCTEGPRRQFFPCYEEGDFFTESGIFRGLHAEDVLLAFRGGRLVGTLGAWDQHAFRQHVVHGYRRPLGWLRPFYNAWARLRGRPPLPAPGEAIRALMATLPLAAGDDAAVFGALVDALRARRAGAPWSHLLLGLHEADPLLGVLRTRRPSWYVTRLYLVCWDDGEPLRQSLDGRPPYLELGCL